MWIDTQEPLSRRLQLTPTHIARPIEDLPLQIGKVHRVRIHQTDEPNASRR
jgi:hypothetical protein